MTEQTADSLLMGGASFFGWAAKNELGQSVTKPYGTKVAGTVAGIGEPQQQTDFTTGALQTWPDGKPKMQFAITLDVDWQNCQIGLDDLPADNTDTQRSLMIRQSSQLQGALRDAIKTAGGSGLQLGAYVAVTLTGEQPSQKGNPLKVYAVEYRLPAQGMVMDGGQAQQQPQAQPQQQAPAQAQPQQAQVPPQNVPQQFQQGGYVQPQAQPQGAPQQPAQGYAPGQQVPAQQPQNIPQAQPQQQVQAPPQGNTQDPVAIAKKLLFELHLPPEQVAASTGLTPEQVQGLANQGSGQTPPPF